MSYAVEFSKQFNEWEFYTKDVLTPSNKRSHRETHKHLVQSLVRTAGFTGNLKQLKVKHTCF